MSCPDHIIDDTERARNNITTAFKLAHDVYDAIIHIGNKSTGLNKDVAALQSSCDALLDSFKSDLLGGSSEHITWAEAAANGFVGNDISRLINEGTPLEDRKNIILNEVLPKTIGPMITRLDQATGLFGPDFPDKVAGHVKEAQDVFNKYDLGQLGDDIGLIFNNIPQDINTFKTAMECFSNDTSVVKGKLEDLVTEEVDNQKFRAGILEASRLTSDLNGTLAQYLSRIVEA